MTFPGKGPTNEREGRKKDGRRPCRSSRKRRPREESRRGKAGSSPPGGVLLSFLCLPFSSWPFFPSRGPFLPSLRSLHSLPGAAAARPTPRGAPASWRRPIGPGRGETRKPCWRRSSSWSVPPARRAPTSFCSPESGAPGVPASARPGPWNPATNFSPGIRRPRKGGGGSSWPPSPPDWPGTFPPPLRWPGTWSGAGGRTS